MQNKKQGRWTFSFFFCLLLLKKRGHHGELTRAIEECQTLQNTYHPTEPSKKSTSYNPFLLRLFLRITSALYSFPSHITSTGVLGCKCNFPEPVLGFCFTTTVVSCFALMFRPSGGVQSNMLVAEAMRRLLRIDLDTGLPSWGVSNSSCFTATFGLNNAGEEGCKSWCPPDLVLWVDLAAKLAAVVAAAATCSALPCTRIANFIIIAATEGTIETDANLFNSSTSSCRPPTMIFQNEKSSALSRQLQIKKLSEKIDLSKQKFIFLRVACCLGCLLVPALEVGDWAIYWPDSGAAPYLETAPRKRR